MLNFNCSRKIEPRKLLSHCTPPKTISEKDARYEASRCLGTNSCEACSLCRLLCPDLAITQNPITGEMSIDMDHCKGCGICAYVCPKDAITMILEESK